MIIDSIEKFKGLSEVYAIPTGNNARYHQDSVKKFKVLGIGRKYVELTSESGSFADKYKPESGATQSAINAGYGINAGYMFFDSLDAVNKYKSLRLAVSEISEFFRYPSNLSRLTLRQASEIKSIMQELKGSE